MDLWQFFLVTLLSISCTNTHQVLSSVLTPYILKSSVNAASKKANKQNYTNAFTIYNSKVPTYCRNMGIGDKWATDILSM